MITSRDLSPIPGHLYVTGETVPSPAAVRAEHAPPPVDGRGEVAPGPDDPATGAGGRAEGRTRVHR